MNKDYISDTEMDQFKYKAKSLKAQRDFAKASILQAKATLKNSQDQLNYTRILGPKEIDPGKGIRGKVIERKVDPGQTVAASFQTPELFTIALEMDKHMYVYASVDEADIGMIRATKERKLRVKFTVDAYPGELFEGDIYDIRLNSTTTQNVVTYPVIIDAPNLEQKLQPGMTANITFPIEAKEDVLWSPRAVFHADGQSGPPGGSALSGSDYLHGGRPAWLRSSPRVGWGSASWPTWPCSPTRFRRASWPPAP